MMIARLVFGLLLAAGIVCFALYIATKNPFWRRVGVVIVKWAVIALLGFFAVLILERVAVLL